MSKVKNFFRKILPRDFFSEFQTVVIPGKRHTEVNKFFAAGQGKFEFELIVRQHNIFAVKIGLGYEKEGRFKGIPSDTKYVEGENSERPFRFVISGMDCNYQDGDKWLVKARAHTFDPDKKDQVLDIYVTAV